MIPQASALAPLRYDGWAEHYDTLLGRAGFDYIWPAFRSAYRRHQMNVDTAIDFGCGTGLFLHALSRMLPAADLRGVDRSEGMLRQAARRLSSRPVKLMRGDLRYAVLPQKADLVTCNFSTINYFCTEQDLRSALINFARHLDQQGSLVLDFLCGGNDGRGVDFTQNITEPGMKARWRIRSRGGNTGGSVIMENCRRDSQQWRCWREMHRQRWWRVDELRYHMRQCGLLPVSAVPLGEVPPERGGRWVQIVARRA